MGQLFLLMIKGVVGTFIVLMAMMFMLRGCVAVVGANETEYPPPQRGTYEVFGVYGKPFIKDRVPGPEFYFIEQAPEIIIIDTAEARESGKNYVDCLHDQKFYAYVIQRYEKEDPVFWAHTIELYKSAIEDCHL